MYIHIYVKYMLYIIYYILHCILYIMYYIIYRYGFHMVGFIYLHFRSERYFLVVDIHALLLDLMRIF